MEEVTKRTTEKIIPQSIVLEMKTSYLDYAMSVIVSRALPDVRDGLKPVHRRILYAMWDIGLKPGAKFRKSATVVGEVLGKYHPHGDTAVYDSLVRLAQSFSMRYPLVHGQGNFGCFTKETKIRLTDGRDLSFGKLIEEYQQGKKNFTFTIGEENRIEIAEIQHPRLTQKKVEIIQVTLDNNEVIKCTPNHQFMLRDGAYKMASDLKEGDSLMPFYCKLYNGTDKNLAGYEQIYQPNNNRWIFTHHLADDFNLTSNIYQRNRGRIRHHIDFNKLNNNPTNILRMHWREHWQTHYRLTAKKHRNDPGYREKLAEGRSAFWSKTENRLRYAKRLSERNKKNWQDQAYRIRMSDLLSQATKAYIEAHPEKRAEFSKRATATLKRLWRNPVYEKRMRANIIKGNKNHATNKTGLVKFLNICRHVLQKNQELTKENFEFARTNIYPYGQATLWETGIKKYFNNNFEMLIAHVAQKNHKVKMVSKLRTRADVYDLTVERNHNFCLSAGIFVHNSVDGDSAAAMRYTEVKLSKITEEMLTDLEKNTVDFRDNYDSSQKEPTVLPNKLPNLLLNGTLGIAVGMATNIPPHNAREVCEAIIHLIKNPESTIEDLMAFVKGPDFPTGGIIFDEQEIKQAYATGRGSIVMRAKCSIVEAGLPDGKAGGGYKILVDELPYQVNKAELIEKIADLVKEEKIKGIKGLRDESDRNGMRITIELKKDSFPKKILNQLYSFTRLQDTFHVNMLALVDGIQPRVLSLKMVLEEYIKHRQIVVRRRTEFDLQNARDREHILLGLVLALEDIDAIIETIKKSRDKDDARANLIKRFRLSERQAEAILEMRLRSLAGLERLELEKELEEKRRIIKELEAILRDPKKILEIISGEVSEIKKTYGDERKTQVVSGPVNSFSQEDLIPKEAAVIMITKDGYIKRLAPQSFRAQGRGGSGVTGLARKEEDIVLHLLSANTHDSILFFTNSGKVFQLKAFEVPEASRTSKGNAVVNFLELDQSESVTALLALDKESQEKFFIMATQNGVIKKVEASEFKNVRRSGLIAITLKDNDVLKWVRIANEKQDIMLGTSLGLAIRFSERYLRAIGRSAQGVTGIRLTKGDSVVGMDLIDKAEKEAYLLSISENGCGKMTRVDEYRSQSRGGKGIKTMQITKKTGKLTTSWVVYPGRLPEGAEGDLILISKLGQVIRISLSSVPRLGRATQGVRLMRLKQEGDIVAQVALV